MSPRVPGKPVWLEINTQRVAIAETFYADLFGWGRGTAHVEPWGVLTMFRNRKRPLGTAFLSMAPFHASRWNVFLSGDVDRVTTLTKDLGGGMVARPADAPGWGRTAELYDPRGNPFTVIALEGSDPKDPPEPGDCMLVELRAPDAVALTDFYVRLFGYRAEVLGDIAILSAQGSPRLLLRNDPQAPAHHPWIPWFRSAAPTADAVRAERFGGIVQVATEDVAVVGRASIIADPTGAYFALAQPPDI